MCSDVLVRFASPTLAGLKTGNLFGYPCSSRCEACRDVREINRLLKSKGLLAVPLAFREGRTLLYLFRPSYLARDLTDETALRLLRNAGFPSGSPMSLVAELSRRLRSGSNFPHEIGLFLGYPPEDVEGFILNKARNYKSVGCWKVYGDENEARKCFKRFDKCTEIYLKQFAHGKSLLDLAVCAA